MNNSFQPGQFYQPPTLQKLLPHQRIWLWYKARKNVTKLGLGCTTLILLLFSCGLCSSLASIPTTTASQTSNQIIGTPTTTTKSEAVVIHKKTSTPTPKPTRIPPTPKPTRIPPTPTPIPPAPTPTPLPVVPEPTTPAVSQQPPALAPTQAPVQQPVQQPATGVNGNPWGYDFTAGNLIYSPGPAAAFCDYFACVTTFWTRTNGYVAECNNGEYTHSGGVSGACSRDGGVYRPLYSH